MKLDSFFYWFFSAFPDAFFTLIGEDQRKARRYRFSSIEVKEQAFRFDGVFLPVSPKERIYFVEAQFGKKQDFYLRLFAEVAIYIRQKKPNQRWRAVVIFPDEKSDPGITHHYEEFFASGRLLRIYLNKLPEKYLRRLPLNLLKIISASEQNVLPAVRKLTRQLPQQVRDRKPLESIVNFLVNLILSKIPKLSLKESPKMLEPIIGFAKVRKSRFYQDVAAEERSEQKKEIAKALLKKKMSAEFISEVTGLSVGQIRRLKRDLTARKR